jgi:hypothetical protein
MMQQMVSKLPPLTTASFQIWTPPSVTQPLGIQQFGRLLLS